MGNVMQRADGQEEVRQRSYCFGREDGRLSSNVGEGGGSSGPGKRKAERVSHDLLMLWKERRFLKEKAR